MKLISMTDFVLEQNYITTLDISQIDFYDKELSVLSNIRNYANFLKQPLKLEMFVPVSNENGGILSLEGLIDSDGIVLDAIEYQEYQQAKEKVLFEGFELKNNNFISNSLYLSKDFKGATIICNNDDGRIVYFVEDLIEFEEIKLTPTGIKQLNYKQQ